MTIGWYSTNDPSRKLVSFEEALLKVQPSDKGLYMPARYPQIDEENIRKMGKMSYSAVACEVLWPYVEGSMSKSELSAMMERTYGNLKIPLVHAHDNTFIERLDAMGLTKEIPGSSAFKDMGCRALASFCQYFMRDIKGPKIALLASSGDTVAAIANAFYKLEDFHVICLMPSNVYSIQRKAVTTLKKNVYILLAEEGDFRFCQETVNRIQFDPIFKDFTFTSGNSKTNARWLPQIVYYFDGVAKLSRELNELVKPIISVPTGNAGNISAGVVATKMGLPFSKLIAAVNENDAIARFVETGNGKYVKTNKTIHTPSSAMDVSHANNLPRIFDLYGGWMDEEGVVRQMLDIKKLRRDVASYSITSEETRKTIKQTHEENKVLIDPHTAVGMAALNKYQSKPEIGRNAVSICLQTADPSKFPELIRDELGIEPPLAHCLKDLEGKEERSWTVKPHYEVIANLLLEEILLRYIN